MNLKRNPEPRIQDLLDRLRQGDTQARAELIEQAFGPLQLRARRMFAAFPKLRPLTQLEDVLHGAIVRLLRAMQEVDLPREEDFYALAATQIRRELIDLARRQECHRDQRDEERGWVIHGLESREGFDSTDDLREWSDFHTAVDGLPTEEREVVGLIFYHGWSEAAVADLFQVSTRTIKRRWRSAIAKLRRVLARCD